MRLWPLLALALAATPAEARNIGSPGVGPQGDPGPAGPQGVKGDAGNTGPIGPSGPAGPVGASGSAGPKGDAGATGATGPTGPTGPVGPSGPAGTTGATGAVGPQGVTGPAGPAGIVAIYGPSGLRANPKAWMGAVTSANGLWSASIASAGCSVTPWNVQVQALGLDQTAAGVRVANVSSVSTTIISGTLTQAATVSLLGVLSLNLSTAGSTTVWVEAFCN